LRRDRQLNKILIEACETSELARGAMRDSGAIPPRKARNEQTLMPTVRHAGKSENVVSDAFPTAARQAVPDHLRIKSGSHRLLPAEHSELRGGEMGDTPIRRRCCHQPMSYAHFMTTPP